jgi:hypothetical protein
MVQVSAPPLEGKVLPQFARELEELLINAEYPELAAQVASLKIVRRCDCEDDFCATFYTQYVPVTNSREYPPCIDLEPRDGQIVLDISFGSIIGVEVLFRDDIRQRVRSIFP